MKAKTLVLFWSVIASALLSHCKTAATSSADVKGVVQLGCNCKCMILTRSALANSQGYSNTGDNAPGPFLCFSQPSRTTAGTYTCPDLTFSTLGGDEKSCKERGSSLGTTCKGYLRLTGEFATYSAMLAQCSFGTVQTAQ